MEKPRWEKRFESYQTRIHLLNSVFQLKKTKELTDLEKEGIFRCFKVSLETAITLLDDYLKVLNIKTVINSPKSIVKAAALNNVIKNEKIWHSAICDKGNFISFYENDSFTIISDRIELEYLKLLIELNDLISPLFTRGINLPGETEFSPDTSALSR